MSNVKVFPWDNTVNYSKYDIVQSGTKIYYSTKDGNTNKDPSNGVSFSADAYQRIDDLVTIWYTTTQQDFERGSILAVSAASDTTVHWTGMVIHAGSGFVQYINPGKPIAPTALTATVNGVGNPAWTTEFLFTPSRASTLSDLAQVIATNLGDGYSQRHRSSLNNNVTTWKLSFQGRSDKETKALQCFIEDKGGTDFFRLLLPVSSLVNNPDLKYISTSFDVSTEFYNLNTVNIEVQQVFDIT